MPPIKWPLVRIRWVDSTSPRMGWVRLSEWEGFGSLECESVGYLIAEDGHSKTIAPHLAYPEDGDQCQGNGIIVIPRQAILTVDILAIASASDGAAQDRSFGHPESGLPYS
jgi:hypothetical protein